MGQNDENVRYLEREREREKERERERERKREKERKRERERTWDGFGGEMDHLRLLRPRILSSKMENSYKIFGKF